jgi:hypothetical protein
MRTQDERALARRHLEPVKVFRLYFQQSVLNRRQLGPPGDLLPGNCVYIGRGVSRGGYRLPKSQWANPYSSPRDGTPEEVVAQYRQWILAQPELLAALPDLGGKHLVCWCAPALCHGDVLLELLQSMEGMND